MTVIFFLSVANEVRAKRELSSRNEYIKFAFCKKRWPNLHLCYYKSYMGLSFYKNGKNGDQIETKKHPKVYVRNFRNFQNLTYEPLFL